MFVSDRAGEAADACGGGDMYIARQSPAGGWSEPVSSALPKGRTPRSPSAARRSSKRRTARSCSTRPTARRGSGHPCQCHAQGRDVRPGQSRRGAEHAGAKTSCRTFASAISAATRSCSARTARAGERKPRRARRTSTTRVVVAARTVDGAAECRRRRQHARRRAALDVVARRQAVVLRPRRRHLPQPAAALTFLRNAARAVPARAALDTVGFP